MKLALTLFAALAIFSAQCQQYDASKIFAHNDYARDIPFYTAYDVGAAYIEADVYLIDHNRLAVAHQKDEIAAARTLEDLYLKPLAEKVQQNGGTAYSDHDKALTLMIDLKTEGPATLRAIVSQLRKYRQLLSCATLHFMISGNVPDPADWDTYPDFITFDGRPGIHYTPSQLSRIAMISTSFTEHFKWDGRTKISDEMRAKIESLVNEAHRHDKPFRFWATPDFEAAWRELLRLNMDVIVTDDVAALAQFLKAQK